MRLILAVTTTFLGCHSAIGACPHAPAVDCCEEDRECADYYGPEFPYCLNKGPVTGVCSECLADKHCGALEYCDKAEDGGFCLPIELRP